jgi:glycosyltransferase involved in cell wall biosynthesis
VRIAVVSPPFVAVPPRAYGGTELVVYELTRGLRAAGHQVTLFATGDSLGDDVRYVYPRPVWPPDREAERAHCAHAARVIAKERFDVVHAHTPALLEVAADLGAPCVYTIHHERETRRTQAYLARPDVHYVAISGRQAALVPELACEVVHHGLDPRQYPLGRGKGGYAAFLGRLSPCKAPEVAIAAAVSAGVPLRLAGEVHLCDASPEWRKAFVAALGRRGVSHLGSVGGRRKVRFLGAACALLMPLRWEEPFGLVMIEAMLCGTPVIAFPRGASPEIVDEGITGFLVEGEADMAAALTRLGGFDRAACRRRAVARFSAARMVAEYERVYARAAAGGSVSRGVEGSTYAG